MIARKLPNVLRSRSKRKQICPNILLVIFIEMRHSCLVSRIEGHQCGIVPTDAERVTDLLAHCRVGTKWPRKPHRRTQCIRTPANALYWYGRSVSQIAVLRALSSQRQCSITCYGYQERTGRFVSVM